MTVEELSDKLGLHAIHQRAHLQSARALTGEIVSLEGDGSTKPVLKIMNDAQTFLFASEKCKEAKIAAPNRAGVCAPYLGPGFHCVDKARWLI